MKPIERFPMDIRWLAVATSLLISVYTFVFNTTPNDDAYTYIRTAEIFAGEGFSAAIAHYEWAGYSITIGLIHQLLGIDLFSAAYILNALFFGLLVYSFISIVKEIDDAPRVLLLAAITILVYPQLNEFRHEVIRDIGYWALSLFAIWQFTVFSRTFDYRNAIGFSLALLFAATLRSEAIAYLMLIPLVLFFDKRLEKSNRVRFGLLYTAGSTALLLLVVLIAGLSGVNLLQLFVDFIRVYTPFISDTLFPTDQASLELGRTLFNEHAANYSSEYVGLFMLVGLAAILLANIFSGIGGPYLILLAVGWKQGFLAIPRHNLAPLLASIAINCLILLVFITITRFLASRYTILLCLMLSVFVPLIVDRLLQWSQRVNKSKLTRRLVGILLVYCFLDAYVGFGGNKNYIYDAADWVALNSEDDTSVLTNNHAIAYYSGRVEAYDAIPRYLTEAEVQELKPGSLIAVEVNYDMSQLFDSASISAIIEKVIAFPDEQDQQLIVYRKIQN